MRRFRPLRLKPRNLNGIFIAPNDGTGLRPFMLVRGQCIGAEVNVCREP